MMRSSAFMRGEGTPAAVRRSTAAFRDGRSCTSLFHHGDVEARKKGQEPRTGVSAPHNKLGLYEPLACHRFANDQRRTTNDCLTPLPPSPASSSLPDSG